ncbi:MAG: beta-lactamase family protein [Fimbriimonadaceae bacterium]|nr:beta-lactamase family protein [Fimbriimonadaceae bacterium]
MSLILAASALSQTSTDSPQQPLEPTIEKVRARLLDLYKEADMPGISVAFVLEDGRSGAASAGYASLETKAGLQPLDRMLSGSVGKTFVSAIALQLVAERKLNLNDKLSKHLGSEIWFKRLPNSGSITLKSLMNHTSGIPEHVLMPEFIATLKGNSDKVWKPADLVMFVLGKDPLFEVGKGWSYADTNYVLLGMAIEKVTKEPLFDLIATRLLEPLALTDTAHANSARINGLVPGYAGRNNPFVPAGSVLTDGKLPFNPQMEYAGGGLVTTPADLARWAKFLYEGKTFPPKLMKDLLTTVHANGRIEGDYGLGVEVRNSTWGKTWGHDGWFPGYLSSVIYLPDKKVSIAVQINTDDMRAAKRSPYAYALEVAKVLFSS